MSRSKTSFVPNTALKKVNLKNVPGLSVYLRYLAFTIFLEDGILGLCQAKTTYTEMNTTDNVVLLNLKTASLLSQNNPIY